MPYDIAELLVGADRFVPVARVRARRLAAPLVWRDAHGSELRARAGDWELTDADGNRWTVAADTFARTYRRLPDGGFAKHELVQAVRLDAPLALPTREGATVGRPGEWLLRDAAGDVWAVPDVVFRARYRREEPYEGDRGRSR